MVVGEVGEGLKWGIAVVKGVHNWGIGDSSVLMTGMVRWMEMIHEYLLTE